MVGVVAINDIKDSISRGELVVVIGTGCSISVTDNKHEALSWTGLIESGFSFAGRKGKITQQQIGFWSNQLGSSDIDDVLCAAEFVGRKLDAPNGDLYARWLNESFETVVPSNEEMIEALVHIADLNIPICTLNYDSLLEAVTGLPTIEINDVRKASAWMRGEEKGILHLHGHWQKPDTCILGVRDYEKTLGDGVRDLFQRYLGTFKRLLFVGCGDTFADPNLSTLIDWLRGSIGGAALQHYALVEEKNVSLRHADPAWQGFVDPLSYGVTYSELPAFIKNNITTDLAPKAIRSSARKKASRNDRSAKLLSSYKEFLVRDCGQMTIEGVRADMDTAQRRFDLERLFVPLDLLPCPPDISVDDPGRQKKLSVWKRKNKDAQAFGQVFSKTKGLALLALPGGGKSLLLKRLAVAYCSPERRLNSDDKLPDLDLMPVLIRCREWREYITLPIATLLKSLPDITGQPALEGISAALVPLFKQGKILLLVDGLDEIHDDADRTVFVDNLRKFLDQFPKTKLVVTSREAGFNLVAPYLANYCEQWRVAGLSTSAIRLLCSHWHKLMVGTAPEAVQEAGMLGNVLTTNVALRRLAENPLLLTMLLVVKHGAGRLPPDRVSLYGRAVEVLLDTWNIKGHDALNMKEAIPQLSYIAYELMRSGQQTATEIELLNLLESAREDVPQIKRYAKDTPYEFLKRVELRSSLLLEAGHQVEGGRAVPFYQFRHLTFQEYLSALAIVEGNYAGYDAKAPIVKPLNNRLGSDEWKEVVPMTAVLAGKQGESIIKALVRKGVLLKRRNDEGKLFDGQQEWLSHPFALPSVIARLVQSLIEEAQAEPKTLAEALKLIAYFARGGQSNMDWKALCRGPYADELINQAWKLYEPMDYPENSWVRNSYASFSAYRKPTSYWLSDEGQVEILDLLENVADEKVCLGLMTCVGILWNGKSAEGTFSIVDTILMRKVEGLLFSQNRAIAHVALWLWSLDRHSNGAVEIPSVDVLNLLLEGFLHRNEEDDSDLYSFALDTCYGIRRDYWKPLLSQEQIDILKAIPRARSNERLFKTSSAAVVVAFHVEGVMSDSEIATQAVLVRERYKRLGTGRKLDEFEMMLSQIEPFGVDCLARIAEEDELENEDHEEVDADWYMSEADSSEVGSDVVSLERG